MDERINPLIPDKELKCVWMTAGVLSYKLCKYGMQCERCPLYWELRNLSGIPSFEGQPPQEVKSSVPGEILPASLLEKEKPGDGFLKEDHSSGRIKQSLFYHPGHTWVKVEKADVIRIGVDPFLGSLLEKAHAIILPLARRRVPLGENLCSIIQEEGILHIVLPVSGLILSVNEKLKDQPELISRDPWGEGFLVTLKPKNLQQEQKYLFSGEEAVAWYRRERERFKEAVVSELSHDRERLGITMQDGGIILGELKRLIPPRQYMQLVSSFLSKGGKSPIRVRSGRGGTAKFQPR